MAMKMRWLAASLAALLITGGAATVAQRVITQKTRGVLPGKDDSAHGDTRPSAEPAEPPKTHPESKRDIRLQTAHNPPTVEALAGSPPLADAPSMPEPTPQPNSPPVILADDVAATAPSEPVLLAESRSTEPAISPATPLPETRMIASKPPVPPDEPGKLDPVASVETFVERNRKEAETAIQTLTQEAETLRTRLVKVEAALTRWQSFSRALNADQPASQTSVAPATKPRWERASTEGTSRPTQPATKDTLSAEPPADPPPLGQPSEPSTPLPVPPPVESPTVRSTDPSPVEPASPEPPGLPPRTSP